MKNKVLVFGDSIVYGQRDLEMGGWVNRLRLAVANKNPDISCHVFNMGISGQTVGEVLARLDGECGARTLAEANNIIILAAGINDTQVIDGEVLTDKETFRADVKELIAHARNHTPRVIYLGLTPVDDERTAPISWDKTKTWQNGLVKEYDEIISEVCSEMGVRYVYVYDQIDPATNEDGLHPSAEGHAVLADIMYEVTEEYLKKQVTVNELAHPARLVDVFGSFFKSIFGGGKGNK